MSKKETDRDEAVKPRRLLASAVLRAIDACLHALQRLRKRFEAPVEERDTARDGGKQGESAADQASEPVASAPRRKSLLYRATVVALALLFGAAAGTWLAYRGFSKTLAVRASAIERMQEEIDLSKREEARNINLTAKYQKEMAEYRQLSREAQHEAENSKSRMEALEKQLADAQLAARKRVEPPPAKVERPAPRAAPAKPRAAQKTATCAIGPDNLSGNLADCIEKFNRP